MIFVFDSILDWYNTQKMRHSDVSEDPFMIVYIPDRYKTQRMCEKVVDNCVTALKLISDWFITIKMLEKFYNAWHANDDELLFCNEDFDKVTFIAIAVKEIILL